MYFQWLKYLTTKDGEEIINIPNAFSNSNYYILTGGEHTISSANSSTHNMVGDTAVAIKENSRTTTSFRIRANGAGRNKWFLCIGF